MSKTLGRELELECCSSTQVHHDVLGIAVGLNKTEQSETGPYYQVRTILIQRANGQSVRLTLFGETDEDLTLNFSG